MFTRSSHLVLDSTYSFATSSIIMMTWPWNWKIRIVLLEQYILNPVLRNGRPGWEQIE